ncbi:MAG: 30S ribosomal protein S20 [Desulfohalobiaceae bacterium]|nr:30S ribosomal protein S20 [Desulfohalobiaceae bacterium]
MANIKQSLKRHRQSEKARERNKAVRTRVKNSVKQVRSAIQARDKEQAREALQKANSVLDRAASKGVIHRRKAARRMSRLSRQVDTLE